MEQSNPNLAALIGSRICHDLISPIGAINNGLELMGMAGGNTGGPELSLISESVENAGARIRFFRIAFGAAGEQKIGRSEVLSVLGDLNRGARLEMIWMPQEDQPRRDVRLAFLALQCFETAMPYGGNVEVRVDNGSWTLKGAAEKMNVDIQLWANLTSTDSPTELSPAQVQFALLPAFCLEEGRDLDVQIGTNEVTIKF